MASGFLPTPGKVVDGETIGPCVVVCEHVDCLQTRAMAATKCRECGKPIGYETAFVQDTTTPVVADMGLRHTRCVYIKARGGKV